MSENLATAQTESMTPATTGTPGNRQPRAPKPAFWPCVGLVIAGAIYTLVYQVDLAGLTILAAGLIPLVRFRNEW